MADLRKFLCNVGVVCLNAPLWDQLRPDQFWTKKLTSSRKGTNWLNVLKTLVSYRLISPGSEWGIFEQRRKYAEHSIFEVLVKNTHIENQEVFLFVKRQNGGVSFLGQLDLCL